MEASLTLLIMKIYKTESVGKIIEDLKRDNPLLKNIDINNALREVWKTIPDATLQRIDVIKKITDDNKIQIICPSSVTLNYLRQKKNFIKSSLSEFIQAYDIKEIEFILG